MDLVIPWVDGSDPEWLKICNQHRPEPIKRHTLHARYYAWDCLETLLRSIHKYANGVFRKIWIVHDPIQKPAVNEDLVTLVSHDTFMPPEILPTFHSSAIESYIHKIPGLSEVFLTCNDDMWFTAKVTKQTFLSAGLPRIFLSAEVPQEAWSDNGHGWQQPLAYAAELLNREFGKKDRKIPHHLPRPLSKTICWKSWELYERELTLHTSFKFRKPALLARARVASAHMLFQWVGLEYNLATVNKIFPLPFTCREEDEGARNLNLPEFSSPCPYEKVP